MREGACTSARRFDIRRYNLCVARRPRTLYHYTDAGGLYGILSGQTLRFGDVRFLNDRTELQYGRRLVARVLESEAVRQDPLQLLSATQRSLERVGSRSRYLYTFSLSETRESISQWQRYGANGRGYCIGFSLSQLQSTFGDGVRLRKVIYAEREQRKVVHAALDDLRAKLERYLAANQGAALSRGPKLAGAGLALMLDELPIELKTDWFKDEKEWRLITEINAPPADEEAWPAKDEPTMSFARRGDYVRPFIDLAPVASTATSARLPIACIVTGPRLDSALAKASIDDFLRSLGHPKVEIEHSRLAEIWR